jgi:hypothetical protein
MYMDFQSVSSLQFNRSPAASENCSTNHIGTVVLRLFEPPPVETNAVSPFVLAM